MSKRLTIMLPDATIRLLDRVAPKGGRSRFISQAVLHYVDAQAKSNLRERLKQGASANAKLNLEIAEEWFPLEQEAWNRLDNQEAARKSSRVAARSSSRRSTVVAAITSRVTTPPYPNEVILKPNATGLEVVSTVRLDQVRTVDRQSFIKRLGKVDAATMSRVDAAIKISLGLIAI